MDGSELFTQILTAINAHAQAMATRLIPFGIQLLTYLGVIAFSWKFIIEVLRDTDIRGIVFHLAPLSITLGVSAWLIRDLAELSSAFIGGFDWLSATMAGAPPGSSPLEAAIGNVGQIANSLWLSMGSSGDKPPDAIDMIKNTLSGGASFWIKTLILAGMVLIAAITAATFIMSQVLVGIAVALGPVFIPFIVLSRFNFLFDSWLKFLISTALMRLLGVVMLSIGAAISDYLLTLDRIIIQAGQDPRTLNLMAAIVVLGVGILQLMLTWQIPALAQALVSGGGGGALDAGPVSKVASAGLSGARATGDAGKSLGRRAIDAYRNRNKTS